MVPRTQIASEVGQGISVLEFLQGNNTKPFYEAVNVKHRMQRRSLDAGNARIMKYPPRKAVHMERHQSRGEAHVKTLAGKGFQG